MDYNGLDMIGALLMAGVTFPLSFLIARFALRGVVRVVTSGSPRPIR